MLYSKLASSIPVDVFTSEHIYFMHGSTTNKKWIHQIFSFNETSNQGQWFVIYSWIVHTFAWSKTAEITTRCQFDSIKKIPNEFGWPIFDKKKISSHHQLLWLRPKLVAPSNGSWTTWIQSNGLGYIFPIIFRAICIWLNLRQFNQWDFDTIQAWVLA